MRATVMYGAGDVRVENVPDPKIQNPADAVVRSCIWGSDLWPHAQMPAAPQGRRMGHEFLGVVEDVGADVSGLKSGDLVVAPFVWADHTCDFGREGLHTSCRNGGQWGPGGVDGGQGEAVRVPRAQGTLVKLPVAEQSMHTALGIVRDGGAISRLGVPQYTHVPLATDTIMKNITVTGGVGPARAYIEELLPDILEGKVEPGRAFDRTVGFDDVPDGYRAMADREALKVLIQP
ncbi:alcohol dehydrogenase catalytic domain-containing protein [Streptomyces bobili]|uniref:alcohol dehydrogenase catalytic domain-containing protein n=1 Tax=Streptomyces bobili TaxID=67280 RepID=UPI0036FBD810